MMDRIAGKPAPDVMADDVAVMAGLDRVTAPPIGSDFTEALPIDGGKVTGTGTTRTRRAGATPGLVLFAEDFDTQATVAAAEPEIIEPTFTRTELEAARRHAWQDGHDKAAASAAQADAASIREAIMAIAANFAAARTEAAATAQRAADELARLLFDSFAVSFPSLCADYGERELRSLIRTLLPALQQEPAVTIRVNPAHAAAINREIEQANPDLAARMQVVACETISPGDARVAWRGGQTTRDSADLWKQIADILAPAGLISYAVNRETEHVE